MIRKFAVMVICVLAFSACGTKEDKYTKSCKEIGNFGSDVQSCAKNLRQTEKDFKNWKEPK